MYYFFIQVLLLGFVLQSVHASTSCIAGEYYSRTDNNTCMRCPPNSYSLAHSENIESCKCDNADFSVSANVITTTRCTGLCPCPASTGLGSGVITDGYDAYPAATGLSCKFYIESNANVSLQIQWVDVPNQSVELSDHVDVMQSDRVIWNQYGSLTPSPVFTNPNSDEQALFIRFVVHHENSFRAVRTVAASTSSRGGFYAEWWTYGNKYDNACPLVWCDPGSFFRDGTCVACALDTISSVRGPEPCEDCTTGKFSNQVGGTKCSICPRNSHELNISDFALVDCVCNDGFEKRTNGVCLSTECLSTEYADANGMCQECPNVYAAADITQAFESGAPITKCMLLYI